MCGIAESFLNHLPAAGRQITLITGFRAFKYKRMDPGADGEIETKVTVVGSLIGVLFYF